MSFWVLVIILFAMGVVGVITTVDNPIASLDSTFLIAFILIILIVFVIYFIRLMIFYRQVPKLYQQCVDGEYKTVIIKAEKMIKRCQTYARRAQKVPRIKKDPNNQKTPNIMKVINQLHRILAIAYLAEGEEDRSYEQHINILTDDTKDKPFLIALYHLKKDNLESAKKQFELMDESPEMENQRAIVKGLLLSKQGQSEEARAIIEEVYPKLNHAYLKSLASQVLSKE